MSQPVQTHSNASLVQTHSNASVLTCMGELLIDFLPIEMGGQTTGFSMHAGGAPLNVAVGLARLGRPVAFAGKIAGDFFGRYLRAYVEREGIDTRFLLAETAQSTLAFVAPQGGPRIEGGEPAFAFYGEGAADTLLTPQEVPEALFEETSILHFGSISLLRGSTPDAVLSTVERLKGRALLSFDPNLRPGLVRDEAVYRDLLARLFALSDIVKLSAADISWLAPGATVEEYAADLAARGPALIVVTQGSQGVLAVRGEARWRAPAFNLPVVDTVGAGDSFSAGLLAGLSERGITSHDALVRLPSPELALALRFAAAVAALACTRAGADPPRREEVESFLQEHK